MNFELYFKLYFYGGLMKNLLTHQVSYNLLNLLKSFYAFFFVFIKDGFVQVCAGNQNHFETSS